MESLILLAAAIPFAAIIVAVLVMSTVRCRLEADRLKVSVLGISVRDVPLSEIISVEFMATETARRWGLIYRGATVIVEAGSDPVRTVSVNPKDPEGFAMELKARVKELTGREV